MDILINMEKEIVSIVLVWYIRNHNGGKSCPEKRFAQITAHSYWLFSRKAQTTACVLVSVYLVDLTVLYPMRLYFRDWALCVCLTSQWFKTTLTETFDRGHDGCRLDDLTVCVPWHSDPWIQIRSQLCAQMHNMPITGIHLKLCIEFK